MPPTMFTQIQACQGHKGSIYGMAVDRLQKKIFTAGSDSFIVEWAPNAEDGKLMARANGIVYSLSYIEWDGLLIAGNSEGAVHVIDTKNNSEIRLLKPFDKEVFCTIWIEATSTLAIGSADGQVIFYNKEFEPLSLIKISNAKIRSLVYESNTHQYYVGTAEGKIIAVDASEYKVKQEVQAHQQGWSVNCLCLLADEAVLVSGGRDAMLNSFDLKNGLAPLQKIPAHNYAIYSLQLSPDNKKLLTASRDKTVKVWDAHTLQVLQRMIPAGSRAHSYSINCAMWIDNHHLACVGDAREVYFFKETE